MIRLYSYRFQIECTFKELKQQTGAFCYHFWSKHMPKLDYYRKKSESEPLKKVTDETFRKKILETVKAIEMHVTLSYIAMGIVQILSVRLTGTVDSNEIRYLRTSSAGKLSEATIMYYLRHPIFRLMAKSPELCIAQFIHEKQERLESTGIHRILKHTNFLLLSYYKFFKRQS